MKSSERVALLSGAFFLFGLAGLIWLHAIWPGIMLLILLTALPILLVEEGWRMTLWLGLQMGIWLGGIPLLMRLHLIWPGVLVLAGMSALLVAFANPEDLEATHRAELARKTSPYKIKAKRGIPVPHPLDDDDILNIEPFNMPDEDDNDESYTDCDDDQRPNSYRTGRG